MRKWLIKDWKRARNTSYKETIPKMHLNSIFLIYTFDRLPSSPGTVDDILVSVI
jgi:hypothetical protein